MHTMVIKTHTVNERLMLWQTKHSRLGVTGLREGGHGTHLNKTKAASSEPQNRFRIFVQARCQSDGVEQGLAKESALLTNKRRCLTRQVSRTTQHRHGEVVCRLRRKRQKERLNRIHREALE